MIEVIINEILLRGLLETHFTTIPIPAQTTIQPLPLENLGGGCIALYLRINKYELLSTTATEIAANQRQLYYGDSNHQEFELVYGETSKLIFARNFSDVYIKGNGTANSVQVISYHIKA